MILNPRIQFLISLTTLLDIAERTIPQSSISSKPRKPWFDDECKQAIKERKKSEKAFRRSPCHSKLSSFRIHRAKARRTIKRKKRASWKQFVSSINNRTPMNKIWNIIKGRINSFAANVADRRHHSRLPTSPIGDLSSYRTLLKVPVFIDIL